MPALMRLFPRRSEATSSDQTGQRVPATPHPPGHPGSSQGTPSHHKGQDLQPHQKPPSQMATSKRWAAEEGAKPLFMADGRVIFSKRKFQLSKEPTRLRTPSGLVRGAVRLLTLTLRWTLRKVRSGSKQRSPWSAGAPPSSCQVLLSASCARTTYPSRRSAGEGLSLETRKTRKTRPGEVQELAGPHSLDSDPGVSDASPQSRPQARTAEDRRANETGAPRPDGGGRRQTTGRGAPGC